MRPSAPANLPLPTGANVDGLQVVDATHFYLSFSGGTTAVPGLGNVQDEDVVYYNAGTWSVYFDGTAPGLTNGDQDLDAIAFGAVPPPPALTFSTAGGTNPPGVGGTADDSDIYGWLTAFSRQFDATANGVLTAANVDGLDVVDATHFYLSFSADTTLPVIGAVQDEDVVYFNAGTWSVYFDGTAQGLTAGTQDLDEISIVGATLYFSTAGDANPTGVLGTADDADIYSWNGTVFARVWDASTAGVPSTGGGNANVDGLHVVDATHFYLSFSNTTTAVTGLGTVQDEDVIYYNAGTWSVYFNGTARGLTDANEDLDAIDVA